MYHNSDQNGLCMYVYDMEEIWIDIYIFDCIPRIEVSTVQVVNSGLPNGKCVHFASLPYITGLYNVYIINCELHICRPGAFYSAMVVHCKILS